MVSITSFNFGNTLPHEKLPSKKMPISLGSFLFTRSNLIINDRNKFVDYCNQLSKNDNTLSSDIATKIIEFLEISMLENYTALVDLINQWRTNG